MTTLTAVATAPGRALRRLYRRISKRSLKANPDSAMAWIIHAQRMLDVLPLQTRRLIENHDLHETSHALNYFEDEIKLAAGAKLRELAQHPTAIATASAVDEIVKWLTIKQCAHSHKEGLYYEHAELHMGRQWDNVIWPIIHAADFTHTLELACGHGRNTDRLRHLATTIDLVDVNETCISACRSRFGTKMDNCTFRYHVTTGNKLPVDDQAITFGYSWDSMVHFDKLVVEDYVREFARAMKPGAQLFLHHSNYGAVKPDSNWATNHGNRSDMTAEQMQSYARDNDLNIVFQRLSGRADGWGMDDLDCLTLLQKPAA